MLKRFVFLAAAVLAITASPASASSILVTDNTTFSVNWLNTVTNPDLSGTARFTITGWSATGFDLTIDQVANTTPTTPDINARFVSFGFGLTPDATHSNAIDGSVFAWGFSNFPGFGTIDVCGFAGNNCGGGGNGGLGAGESQLGSMSIHFDGDFANGVTFAPIAAKFQTNVTSYEFDSCVAPCSIERELDPPTVPEPGSLVLMGSGFVGFAAILRRRQTRKA
jgi:hypothetical protein